MKFDLNKNPIDVAGAGDSMLVASGLCLAAGGTIWAASALGSYAAAIQVSRLGNIPIDKNDLIELINNWKLYYLLLV